MPAPLIDYEGFEDLDDHRFLWMALLHLDAFAYGWGDHQIYLLFNTQHPGFSAPTHILEQHPQALPIILQHQYEDLKVSRNQLSVTVGFNGLSCRIEAQYDAVVAFQDSRANFSRVFSRADFSRVFGPACGNAGSPAITADNVVSLFPVGATHD